ncbi:hypothetical protein AB6A40_000056 [Gnathostoma spinigerum]|uniref:Uncharacterized protein n=1 Tax=Gnathostoma spinigerum TaxID=75299 RepID=A0ABD6E3D2_9BILA
MSVRRPYTGTNFCATAESLNLEILFLLGQGICLRSFYKGNVADGSHVGGVSKVCIDIETTQKGEEEVEERSDKKRKNKESESDESEDTEQVFTSKKDKENLEGEKESTKVGKGRNAGMGIPGVPRGIETISEVHNVSLSPGGFVGNEIEPFDGMPVVSTPKRLSKKSTKSKTKLRKQHKFPLDIWKLPVEEIPEPHKVSLRPGDLPGKGLGGFHGSPLKVSGAKSKSDVGEANILGLPLDNVSVSQNVSFQPRDFGEIGIDGIDNMSFVNAPKSTSKRLNRIVEDERDKLSRQDAPNTPSRNVTYDTLMSNVTEPKKVAETDPVAQILPAAKQLKESKYRQKPLRLPVGTQQIDSCQKDASQEQVSHFESRREGKCEKTIPRDVVRQVLKQIAGDLPTDVNDVIRQYVKMDEFPSKCESWRDTFRRSRKDDDYHRGIFRQQPSPDSSKSKWTHM